MAIMDETSTYIIGSYFLNLRAQTYQVVWDKIAIMCEGFSVTNFFDRLTN